MWVGRCISISISISRNIERLDESFVFSIVPRHVYLALDPTYIRYTLLSALYLRLPLVILISTTWFCFFGFCICVRVHVFSLLVLFRTHAHQSSPAL